MNWLEKMDDALAYIENNLEGMLDYNEIAKKACCSKYHFSRMFSSITGISLSEYIRRRKLSLAAFELQKGEQKIIDIALKYGYDSTDSFSRAFKKIHGVIPSKAKKNGIQLKAFPKLSLQIKIKGDVEMDYRIEKLDFQFSVVGVKYPVKTKNAFRKIPKLWKEAKKSGITQKLIDMSWENPKCKLEGLLGICGEGASINEEEFNYFMGIRYEKTVPEGMEKLIISKSTWAVFPNIVEAWKRLYNEWLPTSNYNLADLPCIECFYPPGHKPKHELWVPIKNN
jgi:AraC family transcriptional regulator